VRIDPAACERARQAYVAQLEAAPASCTEDSQCRVVHFETHDYALSGKASEAHDRADRQAISSCGLSGSVEERGRCVEGQCKGPAGQPDAVTRPKPDLRCLTEAFNHLDHPIQFKGLLILKVTIFADGQLNYFQVIKGPETLSRTLLARLGRCRAEPSTARGQPLRVDYVFNLNLK
jgi:hypothetical protein